MHHEPVWVSRSAAVDGLEVEVSTQPAVNLALVHNRVPLVQFSAPIFYSSHAAFNDGARYRAGA